MSVLMRRAAVRASGMQASALPKQMRRAMQMSDLEDIRENHPIMFCYQCEQTSVGTGCDRIGMCGKRPKVAVQQDLLVHLCKGISCYAHAARQLPQPVSDRDIDRFVFESLFSTMTNVNNDSDRFQAMLTEAVAMKQKAKAMYEAAGGKPLTEPTATYFPKSLESTDLQEEAEQFGVLDRSIPYDADTFGLIELIAYGVKGTAAYAHHAMVQGFESETIYAGVHSLLSTISETEQSVAKLLPVALKCGEVNLEVMALLEKAHITTYGKQTPRKVSTKPVPGKCILVSGHDIKDLANILKQTEGTGINVYTHGELLPGHGYPELQKFPHLVGHYGGAWQKQRIDFADFPGAIVMTTNCIIEPKPQYKDRLFTRTVVGWPGVKHIEGDDFSAAIKKANECAGFREGAPAKTPAMTTGFGADAILEHAGTIVDAVKSGALKHFFVIGGCDGRESQRSYFTDLAKNVPKDSVILTLGCGKFRFNSEEFGDIGGVPRLLDVGQCNDAYGAVRVALALKDAVGAESVNDLPLSFGVSWFEQKAVAVLLTLLHLDIKNIHLGPRLPAFLTPNLVEFLSNNYGIKPVGDGAEDAAAMYSQPNNHFTPKSA